MYDNAISMLQQANILAMIKVMETFTQQSENTEEEKAEEEEKADEKAEEEEKADEKAEDDKKKDDKKAKTSQAKPANTAVVDTMDTLKWVFVGIGIFFGLLLIGGLIYWVSTMFSSSPNVPIKDSASVPPVMQTPQTPQTPQPAETSHMPSQPLISDISSDNDLNKYSSSENDTSLKNFDSIDDYLPSLDTYKTSNSNSNNNIEYYDANSKPDETETHSYILPETKKESYTGGLRRKSASIKRARFTNKKKTN